MQRLLEKDVKQQREVSVKDIAYNVSKNFCTICTNSDACFSSLGGDTTEILSDVVMSAKRHGKASIIDMPPFITGRCKNINGLIQCVNDSIMDVKVSNTELNNINDGQNALATELGGVAKILDNLALHYKRPVSFDEGRERKILDELAYHGIDAKEVLVYGDGADISISLVIKTSDVEKVVVSQIISTIMKVKLQKISTEDIGSGFSNLILEPAPRIDIVYSVASMNRDNQETSGDITLCKRLGEARVIFSVSDGMGSGAVAESVSTRAVETISSFFDAGFQSDVVMRVANRMLTLSGGESFSAVDILSIDLNTGASDFIKLGGVFSAIKHEDDISIIEGHALPLGVISNAKPYFRKEILTSGDIVVLMTDGITDVLGVGDISDVLSSGKINPEVIANEILTIAKKHGAVDDATVLVIKVFSNI